MVRRISRATRGVPSQGMLVRKRNVPCEKGQSTIFWRSDVLVRAVGDQGDQPDYDETEGFLGGEEMLA